MFFALCPPPELREDLSEFLAPREGMPWIDPAQWHVTLAFMESVPEHRIDEMADAFAVAAARREPFDCHVGGAGTFPDPTRAKVLWLGVRPSPWTGVSFDHDSHLHRLAVNARAAANNVGGAPDGKRFQPHLTLAHLKRPIEATKWLRVLDTYQSPTWHVRDVALIASHLHAGPAGRPRHEVVATIPLGTPDRAPDRFWVR